VAVVLILVTERARPNGPAYVAGWCVGLAAVLALVLVVAEGADADDDGQPATWASVLKLLLGAALLLLTAGQWRKRNGVAETPTWMAALDRFTPVKAAGAGVLLSAVNPKNLLLVVAGGAAIAGTGIAAEQQLFAGFIFILVASLSVAAPVLIYLLFTERASVILDDLKDWLIAHNAAIMAVLFLVLGVKLMGDGISGL
jgi:threonine/homoserine/homoserine lactone efflux protein